MPTNIVEPRILYLVIQSKALEDIFIRVLEKKGKYNSTREIVSVPEVHILKKFGVENLQLLRCFFFFLILLYVRTIQNFHFLK